MTSPGILGAIPGIEIGASFVMRADLRNAKLHRPIQAGIDGGQSSYAFSVVLSGGGYPDDDEGDEIVYTGCGGCDSKGIQTKDQEFKSYNMALVNSKTDQTPVRVIRGHKLPSRYAPDHGYRYDGLYLVEDFWQEVGRFGFKICRFRLRRIEGQSPLPPPKENLPVAKRRKIMKPTGDPKIEQALIENNHIFNHTMDECITMMYSSQCMVCGKTIPSDELLDHVEMHRNTLLDLLTETDRQIIALRSLYNNVRVRHSIDEMENAAAPTTPCLAITNFSTNNDTLYESNDNISKFTHPISSCNSFNNPNYSNNSFEYNTTGNTCDSAVYNNITHYNNNTCGSVVKQEWPSQGSFSAAKYM